MFDRTLDMAEGKPTPEADWSTSIGAASEGQSSRSTSDIDLSLSATSTSVEEPPFESADDTT